MNILLKRLTAVTESQRIYVKVKCRTQLSAVARSKWMWSSNSVRQQGVCISHFRLLTLHVKDHIIWCQFFTTRYMRLEPLQAKVDMIWCQFLLTRCMAAEFYIGMRRIVWYDANPLPKMYVTWYRASRLKRNDTDRTTQDISSWPAIPKCPFWRKRETKFKMTS